MALSAVRGGAAVLAGNVAYGLGSFATYAALARILDPPAFGRLSAALGLVSLCALISIALGNATAVRAAALAVEGGAPLAEFVRRVSLRAGLGMVASTLLLATLAVPLGSYFGIGISAAIALSLACGSALGGSVVRGIAQGMAAFGSFAAYNAIEVLIRFVAAIVFALEWRTTGGLLAFALGSSAAFAVTVFGIGRARASSVGDTALLVRDAFDPVLAVGTILVAAMTSIDVVIVGHVAAAAVVGLYAAIALVGRAEYFGLTAITTVLLPFVARARATGKDSRRIFLVALAVNCAAAIAAALIVVLFPGPLVDIFVGRQYPGAAGPLGAYAMAIGILSIAGTCAAYALTHALRWRLVVPLAAALAIEIGALFSAGGTLWGAVVVIVAGHTLVLAVCAAGAAAIAIRERSGPAALPR